MSLKMIEASRSPVYRRMGCRVISVASGGERQISKNSCDSRNFRNSSYIVRVCQVTFLIPILAWEVTRKISTSLSHDPNWCSLYFLAYR